MSLMQRAKSAWKPTEPIKKDEEDKSDERLA